MTRARGGAAGAFAKPARIFDRDAEWAQLSRFVSAAAVGNRLAVVYGRRRQGKSLLLAELAQVTGGFYWEAAQQSRAQNLEGFSTAWAAYRGLPGRPRFASWQGALEAIFGPTPEAPRRPGPVLLDEVGHLVETAPEFPSLLQRFLGPEGEAGGATAVVLCGSVFASMTRLFAAGQPLRGRQQRNLRIDPFDYRTAAAFWGLESDPDAAFRFHALLGGTPAYRRFSGGEAPERGDVDSWIVTHLLDPGSPLYQEGEILIAEDPTLADKALYWSVLNAIADGNRRRGDIAAAVGRPAGALAAPLRALSEGAWIEARADPLHARASTFLLTEPTLRTHRVLVAADRFRLERGNARAVWEDAQPRIARLVHGPHLEWMAADWLGRYANAESAGGLLKSVGPAVLRSAGHVHQLDLVVTEPGAGDTDRICAVGEVKAGTDPVGVAELERLDLIIGRLPPKTAPRIRRLLVARRGFTADCRRAARRRGDVELIDLRRLYQGE